MSERNKNFLLALSPFVVVLVVWIVSELVT